MRLALIIDVPKSADHKLVVEQLLEAVANGDGLTVKLPSGWQFDADLVAIEHWLKQVAVQREGATT